VVEEQGEIQNSSFNDVMLSTVQHNFTTNRIQTKLWGLTDNHKVKGEPKAESNTGGIDRGLTNSTEIHNHRITQKRTQA